MTTEHTPGLFACLIGIDDHHDDAYDLNVALNDTRAWWRMTRRLGIAPENVIICTSPATHPTWLGADGAEAHLFEGTRAGFEAAMARLEERAGGNADNRVLLTWTGYGAAATADAKGRGPGLVLADMAPDDTDLPSLADIAARIDAAVYGGERLYDDEPATLAFVDLCRLPGADGAASVAESIAPDALSGVIASFESGAAQRVRAGGESRGGGSWAVQTVLENAGIEDGVTELTIGELVEKAGAMLGALDARPSALVAVGDPRVRVLRRRAGRKGVSFEIWPGAAGRVLMGRITADETGGKALGWLYVAGDLGSTSSGGWTSNTEYWVFDDKAELAQGSPASFFVQPFQPAAPADVPVPDGALQLTHKEFSKTEPVGSALGAGYTVAALEGSSAKCVGYVIADSAGHWVYGSPACQRSLLKTGQVGQFTFESGGIKPAYTDMHRVRDRKR